MTDIAERLARAVLDRIEADRLLNRDNVADAIRKELAVMKGPFWIPPLSPADYAPGAVPKGVVAGSLTEYKPVVPPALYEHMRDIPGIEDKVIEQKPIGACTHVDLTVSEIQEQLRQLPPEMALCKGGPLDGQTIEVKGLKHLAPGHAGAYYANLYLKSDGTIRTQYDWQADAPVAGFAVPPDYPRTDPTRFTAIGGPYSGSHRTFAELAEKFLGGYYDFNIGLKQATWIAKEQNRSMFAVGSTIEMKIGHPIPKGWRPGAGSLSQYATPAPGNMFITKVE